MLCYISLAVPFSDPQGQNVLSRPKLDNVLMSMTPYFKRRPILVYKPSWTAAFRFKLITTAAMAALLNHGWHRDTCFAKSGFPLTAALGAIYDYCAHPMTLVYQPCWKHLPVDQQISADRWTQEIQCLRDSRTGYRNLPWFIHFSSSNN